MVHDARICKYQRRSLSPVGNRERERVNFSNFQCIEYTCGRAPFQLKSSRCLDLISSSVFNNGSEFTSLATAFSEFDNIFSFLAIRAQSYTFADGGDSIFNRLYTRAIVSIFNWSHIQSGVLPTQNTQIKR